MLRYQWRVWREGTKVIKAMASSFTNCCFTIFAPKNFRASYFVTQPLGIQPLQAKGNDSGAANPDLSVFEGYYSYDVDGRFVLGTPLTGTTLR